MADLDGGPLAKGHRPTPGLGGLVPRGGLLGLLRPGEPNGLREQKKKNEHISEEPFGEEKQRCAQQAFLSCDLVNAERLALSMTTVTKK